MAKEPTKNESKAKDDKAAENKAPTGTADDPIRVAAVAAPTDAQAATAGPALTPEQRAGLEPLDRAKDNEEAAKRDQMPNRQTTHELNEGLDPVSGGPTPGITENVAYTAAATGAPPSDMLGRGPAPMPEPTTETEGGKARKTGELSAADKGYVKSVREALSNAQKEDKDRDMDDERIGWRTPAQMGVPGAVMSRLYDSGQYPLEVETIPNGHHFPETGKRYRIK